MNPWGQHCADGRVEIDHGEGDEEVWGTICSNGWTQADVDVVCSMLGFDYGKAVWPYFGQTTAQLYGEGFTTIWLDEVACEGDEKYIGMCKHAPWGNVSCTHGKEAGVVCSDYKLGNSTTDNTKCEPWGAGCGRVGGRPNRGEPMVSELVAGGGARPM